MAMAAFAGTHKIILVFHVNVYLEKDH